MKCCVDCFTDKILCKYILEKGEMGTCDFCKTVNVHTIYAADLKEIFEPVMSLYNPSDDPDGESLAYLLDNNWGIFSDQLDIEVQNSLLDEVRLGNKRPKDRHLESSSNEPWAEDIASRYSSLGNQWFEFSYHIRHERRFLLAPALGAGFSDPKEWLPEFLPHITEIITPNKTLFRARIGGVKDDTYAGMSPFPASEMGHPPSDKAICGRANPPGIPYLYAADSAATAVAEIRPHVGSKVTIATLHPKKDLRIADLTKVHYVGSAFESNLREQIERNNLLNILNQELSHPVVPEEGDVKYVPCQYLSEVILDAGFDGILYTSAVSSKGNNLVLFHSNCVAIDESTDLVKIDSIQVRYETTEWGPEDV